MGLLVALEDSAQCLSLSFAPQPRCYGPTGRQISSGQAQPNACGRLLGHPTPPRR